MLTFDVWVGATLLVVVALAVVDGVVVGEAELVEGVVVGEADTGVVVITVGCVVAAALEVPAAVTMTVPDCVDAAA